MKYLYMYFGLLLALLAVPGGTDAAKLAPAQLVYIQSEDELVSIRTDMGNIGEGESLEEAFADLGATTPGKVFLDTAEYLIVDEASRRYLPELSDWLKERCLVCQGEGIEDLLGAAIYLDAHQPTVKLGDLSDRNKDLPLLTEIDERFWLKG